MVPLTFSQRDITIYFPKVVHCIVLQRSQLFWIILNNIISFFMVIYLLSHVYLIITRFCHTTYFLGWLNPNNAKKPKLSMREISTSRGLIVLVCVRVSLKMMDEGYRLQNKWLNDTLASCVKGYMDLSNLSFSQTQISSTRYGPFLALLLILQIQWRT